MLNLHQIPVVKLYIILFVDSARVIHGKVFKIDLKKKKKTFVLSPSGPKLNVAKLQK